MDWPPIGPSTSSRALPPRKKSPEIAPPPSQHWTTLHSTNAPPRKMTQSNRAGRGRAESDIAPVMIVFKLLLNATQHVTNFDPQAVLQVTIFPTRMKSNQNENPTARLRRAHLRHQGPPNRRATHLFANSSAQTKSRDTAVTGARRPIVNPDMGQSSPRVAPQKCLFLPAPPPPKCLCSHHLYLSQDPPLPRGFVAGPRITFGAALRSRMHPKHGSNPRPHRRGPARAIYFELFDLTPSKTPPRPSQRLAPRRGQARCT